MKKIMIISAFILSCSAGITVAQSAKPVASAKPKTEALDKKSEPSKSCCKSGSRSACCSKSHTDTKASGDNKKKN